MAEIDYTKRSFNYYPTNAIVFTKCIDNKWSQPEVTDNFNLTLHCFAGVFHYAPSCFEGLKAYRGVDGRVRLFRPDENAKRMESSARYLDMPAPTVTDFNAALLLYQGVRLPRALSASPLVSARDAIPVHPLKDSSAKVESYVAHIGRLNDTRESQSQNAFLPMITPPFGNSRDSRPVQPENASSPMNTWVPVNWIEANPVQPKKALAPIVIFPASAKPFKPVHPEKASS